MPRGKRAESNGFVKSKDDKSLEPVSSEQEPGVGHNQLTDDERFALLSRHKKTIVSLREAKKEAAKAVKDAEKLAKSELGDEAVLEIDHMIELETAEGEAKFKANVEREVRVARWLGLPIGSNGDLFDAVDRTPAVDRAAATGKRDGLAGNRAQPNCDPSVPQYAAYMAGYAEGQKIAFNIKPFPSAHHDDEVDKFDDLAPESGAETETARV